MRPARWAGVEDSGGIVERLISDPKPDSASGRVLAKIYVPILFTMKTKKYRLVATKKSVIAQGVKVRIGYLIRNILSN